MLHCKFAFICTKLWSDLAHTSDAKIKFCNHCQSSVYLVQSKTEFVRLASEGECVAIELENNTMLGFPDGHQEFCIQIPPQKLTAKQLTALKSMHFHTWSFSEIKQLFETGTNAFQVSDSLTQLESVSAWLDELGLVNTIMPSPG